MISDVFVILIIALCTYFGYKKGILCTLINIVSYLASLILSAVIIKPVNYFVRNLTFIESINKSMNDKIVSSLSEKTEGVPLFLKGAASDGVVKVSESLAETLTKGVVYILCAVIVFFIIKLFVGITRKTAKAARGTLLVGGADRFLGLIGGAAGGFLLVSLLFVLAILFLPQPKLNILSQNISNSVIAKSFYENNFIMNLIVKYL